MFSQRDDDATAAGDGAEGLEQAIDATEAATLRQQAENLIKTHVLAATTLGLVPVPLFDLALLIGNQVALVHGLSQRYGVPFDKVRTRAIILSLLSGSAPVLGVIGLSSGAKIMPGIGTLVGSGTVAVSGGALTYAVGEVFVRHFESGGTLLNVDLERMRRLFKRKVADADADAEATAAGGSAEAAQ
jgi:uncharacterized protein (DUF697 family)